MQALLTGYPHNIYTIDTLYVREGKAASHVVVDNNEAVFIDTGPAPACGLLLEGLNSLGLQPENVRYIILTHIHLDHAGGASSLMQLCPNATLLVHPRGAAHMIDPQRLVQASVNIYGQELFTRLYGEIGVIDENRVRMVSEGFVLDFNGRPLHFFDTPGHARHHCCIWDPTSRGVFSGDTCGMAYPYLQQDKEKPFLVPATAPAAFEPDELIKSINRLMKLDPKFLYLTHFGPVPANPESIAGLIDLIDEHGRLAAVDNEVEIESTVNRLLDVLYESYRSHGGEGLNKDQFNDFLGADIELNAQGVAVRNARLKKQQ